MAGKSTAVTVNIVANAAKAAAGFKEAGDAGKAFAESLNKAADKIDADLKQTGEIAERLAKELGENFRTVAGKGVQDLATDIHRAGLSMDDLEGNIDGIVSGLRRMESQADDTGRKMDDIGTNAGKAGNATRSMAGNAVGDLAAMSSGVGILGESVGQLTEGLLEGEVGMKGLVTAGLGMAAIALVTKQLADSAKQHAEYVQNAKDSVERFRKAILDSKSPLQAMTSALTEVGKIELRGPADSLIDVTQAFTDIGISASDVARIMSQGEEGIAAWGNTLIENGVSSDYAAGLVQVLNQQLSDYDKAAEGAAITQKFLAETTAATHDPLYKQFADLKQQQTLLQQLDDAWSDYWNAMNNAAMEEQVAKSFLDGNIKMEDRLRLIGQYVQEVLGFPPDAMERFQVALTDGDLAAAQSYLETLKRIKAVLDGSNYWYAGEARMTGGRAIQVQTNATGTMTANRGLSIVGERGPELISLGGGERIYNANQTAGMMGGTTNVTVNMPAGTNGDELVRVLQQWARTNGALPLAVTGTVAR